MSYMRVRGKAASFSDTLIDVFEDFRRIAIGVGGMAILMFLDVLLGSISLTMAFTKDVELLGIRVPVSVIAVLISSATSAIQIIIWRIIAETRQWHTKIVALLPGLLLAFLDTGLDSALSSWIVYGQSPIDFPPKGASIMFWFVYGVILIITGFNEPLVEIVRQRSRANIPQYRQPPQRPHQTQIPKNRFPSHSEKGRKK